MPRTDTTYIHTYIHINAFTNTYHIIAYTDVYARDPPVNNPHVYIDENYFNTTSPLSKSKQQIYDIPENY